MSATTAFPTPAGSTLPGLAVAPVAGVFPFPAAAVAAAAAFAAFAAVATGVRS